MPSFSRLLTTVAQAYRARQGDVTRSAAQITSAIQRTAQPRRSPEPLTADILSHAYSALKSAFDPQEGGFGTAPKFPQPMALDFLLRYHHRTRDPETLLMVETTLEHMARGGIYDQLGGGFHRYSTDPSWLVPHFEKMLYDNALLSRLYLHAYQATGNPLYRRIAQETLDYVLREMTHPLGGFYSTQDADSQGEEGKYYLWTMHEIEQALGPHEASVLQMYFGVTRQGNFQGENILSLPKAVSEVAQDLGLEVQELMDMVERGKNRLLEVRSHRIPPAKDTKVLTSWNGLMLGSMARGAAILHRADYLQAAVSNASFILQNLREGQRLLRTWRDGQARLKGYLEDYACLIDGLLALHETTLDISWLREAQALAQPMLELFWDKEQGVFYDTGLDHEALVIRPRDITDNAMPCGGSMASEVLLRLSVLTGEEDFARRAVSALGSVREHMVDVPFGFGHWLGALDLYLSSPQEIVVVGPRDHSATQALLGTIHSRYLPNKVLVGCNPLEPGSWDDTPLLEDKVMRDGSPTVYLCHNYVCYPPVTEPSALAQQLAGC